MWYENLLAKNLVPDFLIRTGIRRLLSNKLKSESEGGVETQKERLSGLVAELKESPIAICTSDANEQHYEVPPDFFEKVLGSHLKYSSGLWPENVTSLDASEKAMLDIYCERAQLVDGQDILDLGCGWGSLSLFLASKYPSSNITSVSNSNPQRKFIENRAKQQNIQNLRVITADINTFESEKKFDRVLSIEMFEHMRNYEKLLGKIANWMKPEALLFVHIFSHKSFAYPYETEDANSWMARYFFSGGMMPSHDLFLFFQKDLRIRDRWIVDGKHYQKTCEAWLKKMDDQKAEIMPLFEQTYGKNEATRWWVWWRIFFMACAELFGFNHGKEWFVSHYLFEKPSS